MTNKKKIALLNFPVDGNYGGHLQRYALMEILRAEGAEVTHLNCRYLNSQRTFYKRVKRVIKESLMFMKRLINGELDIHDLTYLQYFLNRDPKTERFYDRYVSHTERIYTKEKLVRFNNYDAHVVGSDQVWRAPMAAYKDNLQKIFDKKIIILVCAVIVYFLTLNFNIIPLPSRTIHSFIFSIAMLSTVAVFNIANPIFDYIGRNSLLFYHVHISVCELLAPPPLRDTSPKEGGLDSRFDNYGYLNNII